MGPGMTISVRRGLDISLPGAPVQLISDGKPISSIAILGADYLHVRPAFKVQVGDRVTAGQTLFVDRRRPAIAFTSPLDGTVTAIYRGPRRSLDALVIGSVHVSSGKSDRAPEVRGREDATDVLLQSGLWTAFRVRPFGQIPDPGSVADAIFVTAMDTNPLAADPSMVIERYSEHFTRGVEALALLTAGPVFVCQAPGPALVTDQDPCVRCIGFEGPHPSGLAGTHIQMLLPINESRRAWTIGYQDVIAIGHFLATGRLWEDRVIALAGAGVRSPRLVRTTIGANLDELLAGELLDGDHQIISGSPLSGRASAYLGRFHTQVSVLPPAERRSQQPLLSRILGIRARCSLPLLPRRAFEQVMAMDIPPIPLLRALSVKDVEAAEALGCSSLVEEDLALLSYVCSSGSNYGALLRSVLDELEERA